jgi:hypothetical protein
MLLSMVATTRKPDAMQMMGHMETTFAADLLLA